MFQEERANITRDLSFIIVNAVTSKLNLGTLRVVCIHLVEESVSTNPLVFSEMSFEDVLFWILKIGVEDNFS